MDQLGIEERELTTAWVYKLEDDALGSLFILLEEPNSSKLGAHLCPQNSQLLSIRRSRLAWRKHRVAGAGLAPFPATDESAGLATNAAAVWVCAARIVSTFLMLLIVVSTTTFVLESVDDYR